jgi:hypothetical protein
VPSFPLRHIAGAWREQYRISAVVETWPGVSNSAPPLVALNRDLEAARYAADRAFRQIRAVEPRDRLVAGEREARWNKALARMAEVESKITAHEAAKVVTVAEPASPATLAADLKTVWSAPSTDARLKKRIVRTVIHEVIADIDPEAAEIFLIILWSGGVHNEIRLPRQRRGQRNGASADVITAVQQLVLVANDGLIAGGLSTDSRGGVCSPPS